MCSTMRRLVEISLSDAGICGVLRAVPRKGAEPGEVRESKVSLRGRLEGPRRVDRSIALGESVWNAGSVAKARGVPFFEIG
jgi:hypothetical protein